MLDETLASIHRTHSIRPAAIHGIHSTPQAAIHLVSLSPPNSRIAIHKRPLGPLDVSSKALENLSQNHIEYQTVPLWQFIVHSTLQYIRSASIGCIAENKYYIALE